jgi:predicted anti-sigma-YlaC factor YlaD
MTTMTTTTKHFSEADLLETYYLQPGESMPVMMHLARCSDCAARYDRLDRKMREAAACHTEKPDTFWARQRIDIVRRIAGVQQAPAPARRRAGMLAAAAVLILSFGGVATYRSLESTTPLSNTAIPRAPMTAIVLAEDVPADPWQSEDLRDLYTVVDWESWSDDAPLPERKSS